MDETRRPSGISKSVTKFLEERVKRVMRNTVERQLREKRILTEAEFAILVRHHPATIGKMRRRGEIDYCQRGGKYFYKNPEHVEAFINRSERPAAA